MNESSFPWLDHKALEEFKNLPETQGPKQKNTCEMFNMDEEELRDIEKRKIEVDEEKT